MKKLKIIGVLLVGILALAACKHEVVTQEAKDSVASQRQQSQYAIAQPVPAYDWSLERDLLVQLYDARNQNVVTHSVWRGMTSVIEGDCTSLGYGLPYDTSLTNPWQGLEVHTYGSVANPAVSIGQAEPNGIFASTNTSATWVFCIGSTGALEPVYVEAKVTAYPGPMSVDYATGRVVPAGAANVQLTQNGNGVNP